MGNTTAGSRKLNSRIRENEWQDQGNSTENLNKIELNTGLKYKLNERGDEVQVE